MGLVVAPLICPIGGNGRGAILFHLIGYRGLCWSDDGPRVAVHLGCRWVASDDQHRACVKTCKDGSRAAWSLPNIGRLCPLKGLCVGLASAWLEATLGSLEGLMLDNGPSSRRRTKARAHRRGAWQQEVPGAWLEVQVWGLPLARWTGEPRLAAVLIGRSDMCPQNSRGLQWADQGQSERNTEPGLTIPLAILSPLLVMRISSVSA